jgi:hypothetical protein
VEARAGLRGLSICHAYPSDWLGTYGKLVNIIEPINVARAAVIDQDAIYNALEERHLGGAALDVWWQYPTPAEPSRRPSRRPFHELPNVLIAPHCSSTTEATADRRWSAVTSIALCAARSSIISCFRPDETTGPIPARCGSPVSIGWKACARIVAGRTRPSLLALFTVAARRSSDCTGWLAGWERDKNSP